MYLRQAKKIGINSEAHIRDNLHFMRYGIDQARRGWLPPDVINTMNWAKVQQWLNRRT
jgi:DNA polymerase (family X)